MKKLLAAMSMVLMLATTALTAENFVFDVSAAREGKTQAFPYNQYGPNQQATPTFTHLIKTKKPKKGDTVEIYFKGTSNIDLPYIAVDLVDNSAAANYWTVLTPKDQEAQLCAKDIKAGTPFEGHITYTLDKDVKSALVFCMRYDDDPAKNDYAKDVAKVGKEAKITFTKVVESSNFSAAKKGRKAKTYSIDVTQAAKLIEMQASFNKDGTPEWYSAVVDITSLFGDDLPVKGDKVTLTYKGSTTISIPEIRCTLVENTAAVGWWRDLVSDNNDEKFFTWIKDIQADKVFKGSVTIPVNVSVEEGISIQMYYLPFEGSKRCFIKFAK